jgi:MFS transporter, DHA2 family, multidrug resistance protein
VLLPEYRDPNAGRPDVISAAQSLFAVLLVIYGLKQIAQDGVGWIPVLCILVGVAIGVGFVKRQKHLADPLIDLRLFRVPAFSASLLTYMLGTFIAFGAFLFTAQYLQLVLGFSPLKAGLWMLPSFCAFIIGSTLTPVIVRQTGAASAMAGGLVLAAAGYGLLTQVHGSSDLATLVTALFISSLGLAPVFTLATDLIVGTAPPERAGAAAAVSETSSELGGALGIAILGSIGTAVYRTQVATAIPPGVPPDAASAARGTLGGALAVAERLPEQLSTAVLGPAREAFTQGMQLNAAICAVIALGTAVVAARQRSSTW